MWSAAVAAVARRHDAGLDRDPVGLPLMAIAGARHG
jgi:hypothetical protein